LESGKPMLCLTKLTTSFIQTKIVHYTEEFAKELQFAKKN